MAILLKREAPQSSKVHFLSTSGVVDGAGMTFYAYIRNDGFAARGHIIRIQSDGTVLPELDVTAPDSAKIDEIELVQSGSTLLAVYSCHIGDYDTRLYLEAFAAACTPYPRGQEPQVGMPGAFVNGENPPPTGDVEAVVRAVTGIANGTLMDALRLEFGASSHNIRQGLLDKAKQAVQQALHEAGFDSQSRVDRGYDQNLMDRVFQVLRDNGVIHGAGPQQGVVTADDMQHLNRSGPLGATTENLAGDGERSYIAAAEPDKGEDV